MKYVKLFEKFVNEKHSLDESKIPWKNPDLFIEELEHYLEQLYNASDAEDVDAENAYDHMETMMNHFKVLSKSAKGYLKKMKR